MAADSRSHERDRNASGAARRPSDLGLPVPQVFGDYLLTSRLALRSMAEVFVAVRLGDRSGRLLVLKRAPFDEAPSGAIAESLRREIAVLDGEAIAGVVKMLDHGEIGGLPFIVLEYVKGQPLDALLSLGPMDKAAAIVVGRDIARALSALHARGWVHGDVAPSNIVVDDAGEATLLDLGIARRIGEPREMPAGKPGYASPEAAVGKPARPSDDVYGWGTVVAECLVGGRLFRETDLAEAAARRSHLPLPIEDDELLASALALDVAVRPTADGIVAALKPDPEGRRVLASAVLSAELRTEDDASERVSSEPLLTSTASDPAIVRMVEASSDRPRAGSPKANAGKKSLRWILALASVLVGVALVGGFFIGRRTARHDVQTKMTLPQIPPRTEIQLDGRTLLGAGTLREIPIDPGSHKLTVRIARRDAKEYEFVAEPGDHVVLLVVPVNRRN